MGLVLFLLAHVWERMASSESLSLPLRTHRPSVVKHLQSQAVVKVETGEKAGVNAMRTACLSYHLLQRPPQQAQQGLTVERADSDLVKGERHSAVALRAESNRDRQQAALRAWQWLQPGMFTCV